MENNGMEEEGGKFVNETTNSRGNEGKRKNRRACDPAGLTQKTHKRERRKSRRGQLARPCTLFHPSIRCID